MNRFRREGREKFTIEALSRTGKMPVPQENLVFVEQASCLFIKPDLKGKMVQRLSYFPLNLWIPVSFFIVAYSLSRTGKMPVPQENLVFVEQASCVIKNRQDACSTRKFSLCGTGTLPVHKA
ncbi:hypothetical protein QUB10_08880 [Microcoleus sp. B5-D4]